jgi:mannose-6-phosphate isomerase-like protein (cupin superfamily)
MKYSENIITDLPQFEEMPGHHGAPPSWLMPGMFSGVDIKINGSDSRALLGHPHADPHIHEDHREIYLCPTLKKGEVLIELEMDGETCTVESPFAILIPQGVKHCFRVLKAEDPYFIYGIHIK